MSGARSVSKDMAKALRAASILAAQRLMPTEKVQAIAGLPMAIPAAHLFRKTRGNAVESKIRCELYWLLHTGCGMPLTRVGAVITKRDKSTVASGVAHIEEAMSDPGYAHRMERLAALAREAVAVGELEDEATAALLKREARR